MREREGEVVRIREDRESGRLKGEEGDMIGGGVKGFSEFFVGPR